MRFPVYGFGLIAVIFVVAAAVALIDFQKFGE